MYSKLSYFSICDKVYITLDFMLSIKTDNGLFSNSVLSDALMLFSCLLTSDNLDSHPCNRVGSNNTETTCAKLSSACG